MEKKFRTVLSILELDGSENVFQISRNEQQSCTKTRGIIYDHFWSFHDKLLTGIKFFWKLRRRCRRHSSRITVDRTGKTICNEKRCRLKGAKWRKKATPWYQRQLRKERKGGEWKNNTEMETTKAAILFYFLSENKLSMSYVSFLRHLLHCHFFIYICPLPSQKCVTVFIL